MNYSSRKLLCNALIQPHFDHGCTSWYPLLSKALKTKFQIAQNKCIRFCLKLPLRGHKSPSHFRKINWLLVQHRLELHTSTTVFKYWKGIAPSYLNDMFMPSLNNYNTRSQMALDLPLCRKNKRQKSISFLGTKIWNKVSSNIKTAATTSSFTHRLKKEILGKLQEWSVLFIYFLLLVLSLFFVFFNFLKVDFFYYILCVHISRGTLMEIRTVLDQVVPAIFDIEVYFPSAMLLFYLIILLCSI